MHEIILGTIKLVVALVILALIARLPSDRTLDAPFFESQKWTLNDAYKILIPILSLSYAHFILGRILSPYACQLLNLISWSSCCVVMYGGYHWFIKQPYAVSPDVFGFDRGKFLRTGVRHANIALIFLSLMIFAKKVPDTTGGHIPDYMNVVAWVYFITLLIVVFLGPVLEELLWRGVLYVPVAKKIGEWKAISLLPLVMAIAHLGYHAAAIFGGYLFFLSLYLLYRKSESLYGPIIWHISLNFFVKRSEIARVLVPYAQRDTLDRIYVYSLLFGLLIINVFWLADFLRRKRVQKNHNSRAT